MKPGWKGEKERHSLARQGILTKEYLRTNAGFETARVKGHYGDSNIIEISNGIVLATNSGQSDYIHMHNDDNFIWATSHNPRMGYRGIDVFMLDHLDKAEKVTLDDGRTAYKPQSTVFFQGEEYTEEIGDMGDSEFLDWAYEMGYIENTIR
jgi:hypothetical protein